MTRTVLVAPTSHGVGLTATCLGLIHALQERGVNVGFYKPLGQPRASGTGTDRSTALIRLTSSLRPPDPIPSVRVEKALGEGAQDVLMEEVVAAAEPIIARHDVVVVEGLVPGAGLAYAVRTNVALAKALDADVLLVGAPSEHGDVTHLAETMAIAASTFRVGEHDRVVGAVVNRIADATPETIAGLRDALAARELTLVGAIPFRSELTWPRVRDLVAGLDVSVLNAGEQDRRVKDVIVGAQAVPGILPLLREGVLVIVPGDRDELVLSVCLAAMNGTRLAGMLLTLGVEPDPRVLNLGRPALATGLPMLVTSTNSYQTATIVHDMDPEVPIDDAERARLVMTAVADALDPQWLDTVPTSSHVPRLSPPAFRRRLATSARAAARRIVLPEGAEPRTLRAAAICHEQGIAQCVLLAEPREVAIQAAGLGLTHARWRRGRRPDARRRALRRRTRKGPPAQGNDHRYRPRPVDRPDHAGHRDAPPRRGGRAGRRRIAHHGIDAAARAPDSGYRARRGTGVVGVLHVSARRRRHLRRLRGQPESGRRTAC